MRYAGLSGQIIVSLGIALFIGYKLDYWINIKIPVFIWLLPLVVLSMMIYKLIKDTSKDKDAKTK
ncbi:MAG: hypothetical protein C4329_03825 [Chitinophagaceae bacterium]